MTAVLETPLFNLAGETVERLDAPTARLLLPNGAPEEEWHAVRRSGIGGSDVAAILGLAGKYNSPRRVFEAKHGRKVAGDVDTEYAEVGREIEDFIARLFAKRSGLPIGMPPGTLVHVEHSWMRANVDRYVLDPATGLVVAPLECKNRSEFQIDDWEDGVPDGPALQSYWYMAVGGWSHAWVAALVGGNKLRYHRLERDQELIGDIVEHCGRWFQRHVVEGFPPPPDGLEDTKNLLGRLWKVKPDDIAEVDMAKAKALRARRAELKEKEKALGAELAAVENEMRLVAGAAETVKVGKSVAWTWKANGTFAGSRFAKEHPELAAEYVRTVEELDVDRLKVEQPELYAAYRARTLRVPTKEI
ncbi:YqaJ viral recombinase family protein [Streptomyces sp. NRRL S-350]|uniref:YqaJ viral recombinase family nuclease n=1 Tax=Streptomyces sp. NRRL S-350 TaxID=1463902 RepID=UPI00068BF4F8|nr:YqaJ viral recombinase family protein [Streptomyces sp. NRRL S-350]